MTRWFGNQGDPSSMRSRSAWFNCDKTIAVVKRYKLMIVLLIAALAADAAGQDQMVLGPRQFERDNSGRGAVLCVWSIYLSIQAHTKDCGLPRRPADDVIDEAIAEIDEFILANSSLHPTRAALEDFKRRAAESERRLARQRSSKEYCQNNDYEIWHSADPGRIRADVKALLSIPREPVMNPCL